jgi:hypothetical protein
MIAVLCQLSSSSNNKRQVGFADSINWEEEKCRSCRGSESRRRKREKRKMKRKMESEQRTKRMLACLEIIRDDDHVDGLVQVCTQSRLVRGAVLDLVLGDVDEFAERQLGENGEGQLRRLLTNFRSTGKQTFELLNDQEKASIGDLMGLSAFHEKFKGIMPSTVVSSKENTPERDGPQARTQARRDHVQKAKNNSKWFDRSLPDSPGSPLANPPDVVLQFEDS